MQFFPASFRRELCARLALLVLLAAVGLRAQQQPVAAPPPSVEPVLPAPPTLPAPATPKEEGAPTNDPTKYPIDKRILGVLPNYRTANEADVYAPISNRRKLWIATKDSTDGPIFANAFVLAVIAQANGTHPSFGQGIEGFGHRYFTGLGDQLIGNYLTEGVFPVLLHEDPRYFRRGRGSKWGRTWYAATRIFVTKSDSGKTMFNFAEVLGNATAAGIANAYYPDERGVLDNFQRLWTQLATDAVSQVLKEFWPDIKHHYHERHIRKEERIMLSVGAPVSNTSSSGTSLSSSGH